MNAPTYEQYTAWIATLRTPVQPYTRKQWDNMSTINKYGIARAMRTA